MPLLTTEILFWNFLLGEKLFLSLLKKSLFRCYLCMILSIYSSCNLSKVCWFWKFLMSHFQNLTIKNTKRHFFPFFLYFENLCLGASFHGIAHKHIEYFFKLKISVGNFSSWYKGYEEKTHVRVGSFFMPGGESFQFCGRIYAPE